MLWLFLQLYQTTVSIPRRRNNTRQLFKAVEDCCSQFGVPEPGVFLAHMMAGSDPRAYDALIAMGRALAQEYETGPLPADVWAKFREYINRTPPFVPVDRQTSMDAARALLPYIYSKRHEVELDGTVALPVTRLDMTDEQTLALTERVSALLEAPRNDDERGDSNE